MSSLAIVFFFLNLKGAYTFIPFIYFFGLIPLMDYLLGESEYNFSSEEEEKVLNSNYYELVIILSCLIHLALVLVFLNMTSKADSILTLVGLSCTLGFSCGLYGINLGHELGHRNSTWEKVLANIMLFSSLYSQFFITHNKSHHKLIATPEDANTSKINQNVYHFWIRSIYLTTKKAFEFEVKRLKSKGLFAYGPRNLFILQKLIEVSLLVAIYYFYGVQSLLAFMGAALFGILLLETINYIEHYGLLRKRNASGRYEKVQVWHSWNSNHVLGRALLFELSRHSDHHANASRRFQVLRHFDESPQLPYGYPHMVVMSLFPKVFMKKMNPLVERFQA